MMTTRSDLMLTTPVMLTTQQRALVDAIENEGWRIRWASGINCWMGMHLRSGTIYYLSYSQDRFVLLVVAPNGRAVYYTRLSDYEPWELHYNRAYIPAELSGLPDHADTFPSEGTNFYDSPGYGRLQVWQDYAREYHDAQDEAETAE